MSEIEKAQAEAAEPEKKTEKKTEKKEPWLKKYLPSWWVFQPKAEKVKKPVKQEIVEWCVTLAAALVIAFLARTLVFEPVRVDGDSMYPTLHDGEFMYVSKLDYGTSFLGIPFTGIGTYITLGDSPELFDVVVCNYPGRLDDNGARLNFVKRVVALPGDTVELRGGMLYVNGVAYEEELLCRDTATSMQALTIPAKGDVLLVQDGQVLLNGVAQAQTEQYLSVILHELMDGGNTYALPETGDTFEINKYYVYVNGRHSTNWASLLLDAWNGKAHTVSEDHFFLMGDNRNNSHDSRSSVVGPVPRSMIVGRVEGVMWRSIPASLDWQESN